MTPYAELERRFARLAAVQDALGVLHWDMSTMMPPGGAAARAEQMAQLGLIAHQMLTDPAIGDLLESAEAAAGTLDSWQAANLREMRRQRVHATALPPDLVEAQSRAVSASEMAWRAARPANDFAGFRPHLEEVVRLTRAAGEAKGEALGCSPYDALVDAYEPGGRAAAMEVLFDDLAAFLPPFLRQVEEAQARRPMPRLPEGPFPVATQRRLARKLMTALGFDFDHGRLDVSLHPFSGGVPDDVRITTRYQEDNFQQALMGVLHETGHALYERGLPARWRGQPVGQPRGMVMHESQSLLVEMQVCRGADFVGWLAPQAKAAFGGEGEAWSAANMVRLSHRVSRGLIRVDADEVTYPLHIIVRFRLERSMLSGDLAVADLPEAWNAAMADLLGITVPNDSDGCLQDIHWPVGSIGYFPTYSLGAMAAAQLFAAAREQRPEIARAVASGDFAPLRGWLVENVHSQGSLHACTDDLLRQVTGQPLGTAAFKAHLQARYLP